MLLLHPPINGTFNRTEKHSMKTKKDEEKNV